MAFLLLCLLFAGAVISFSNNIAELKAYQSKHNTLAVPDWYKLSNLITALLFLAGGMVLYLIKFANS